MKIKLDENFGTRTQAIFQAAGHDVKDKRPYKNPYVYTTRILQLARSVGMVRQPDRR